MDCEVAASPGCPLAEDRGSSWTHGLSRLFQERIFLTVSNYIFTAIFVGEMTLKVPGFTCDLSFPLSGPQSLVQPPSAGHPLAPQQHSTGGVGGPSPLGASHWVGLLGRWKEEGGEVSSCLPGGAHNTFPVSWRYLLEAWGHRSGFCLGCFRECLASSGG